MPIKRARFSLQSSAEVTNIRRRHTDALRKGHSQEIATMIANGKLPEDHPVSGVTDSKVDLTMDIGDSAKKLGAVLTPGLFDSEPVDKSVVPVIPKDLSSLSWKELQNLAGRISGRSKISSRVEAMKIIEEARSKE